MPICNNNLQYCTKDIFHESVLRGVEHVPSNYAISGISELAIVVNIDNKYNIIMDGKYLLYRFTGYYMPDDNTR